MLVTVVGGPLSSHEEVSNNWFKKFK